VDLPVFFFIDADVLDDPSARDVRDVVLSYTFFGARRNEKNGQLECVFCVAVCFACADLALPPAQARHRSQQGESGPVQR
jgi:cytochrome c oxidase assembly protein Cox11